VARGDWAAETTALRRVYQVTRQTGSGGPAGPGGERGRARPVEALAGVDLGIRRGELYGLLGPNGAGKTTLLKILTTLLYPTDGVARVAGYDVVREAGAVRRRIALVSGGEYSGYGILTVRETLWLFGQFYGVPSREAHHRADALMATVGLADLAHARVNRLSTGQRQRLNFARGFMSEPEIIFLDEPTLGLDVSAARDLRAFLRAWLAERPARTVVLTTHYMLEADELCDRVSIIDGGRILATDSPTGLRARVRTERRVVLEVAQGDDLGAALAGLGGLSRVRPVAQPEKGTTLWHFHLAEDDRLGRVLDLLARRGTALINLTTHEPSLEDVFVAIVGRGLEDDSGGQGGAGGGDAPGR
jgi:ABC-2 type transport system ATP-binding protein